MTYLSPPGHGRRRLDVVLLVVLLFVGALASALSTEQQSQVEAAVRSTVLFPFLELHRTLAERAAVGRRASDLEAERDSLVAQVARYRSLAEQGRDLRGLAGVQEPELGTVRAAEVYPGRPRVGDPDVFVLRGSGLAELEFPVGVFTGEGVVGVARGPHGSGARGEFWSDPDFRVSVVTEDGEVSGIVRPVRLSPDQPILLLDGAPFQSDIVPGTRLVTTGVAGVYPPGLTVGTVRELADEEAGWMKRYFVEPAVLPAETHVVLVWVRPPLDSLLESRAEAAPRFHLDSLAARVPDAAAGEGVAAPDSAAAPDSITRTPASGPSGVENR